jgi:hypothetical protein
VTRLTVQWQDEAVAFNNRDLSDVDYVYVWTDGIVRHEALVRREALGTEGGGSPPRQAVAAAG